MIAFVSLTPREAGQLQTLIRLNLESHKCFQSAADRVDDAELTALFYRHARQHRAFAEELERFVDPPDRAGEPGQATESAAPAIDPVHRGWQALRQRLVGDKVNWVLRFAERVEREISMTYETALRHPSREDLVSVLERQRDEMAGAIQRIRSVHAARELRRAG